jgi:hypothetical protein
VFLAENYFVFDIRLNLPWFGAHLGSLLCFILLMMMPHLLDVVLGCFFNHLLWVLLYTIVHFFLVVHQEQLSKPLARTNPIVANK